MYGCNREHTRMRNTHTLCVCVSVCCSHLCCCATLTPMHHSITHLTLHCWLTSAQLRDTFSTLLPVTVSSSLTPSERVMVTPGSMLITRTRLSPRKLRTSRTVLESTLTLMGKWAYTRRILYWKPLVTPVMRFSTCETTVRREASCLRRPECRSTLSFLASLSSMRYMSRAMCLKSPVGESGEKRGEGFHAAAPANRTFGVQAAVSAGAYSLSWWG